MLHLRNVQALLPSKSDLTAALNPDILKKAGVELTAAEHDFSALRADLSTPSGTVLVAAHLPKLGDFVDSGAALAAAADEACLAGLDLVNTGQTALAVLKGGFFAPKPGDTPSPQPPGTPPPPILNTQTLAQIKASFEDAVRHLNAAVVYAGSANLSSLPSSLVKPKQLAQLHSLIVSWPSIQRQLAQVDGWLTVAPTILGALAPENLLLLLMDRSELRSTGGFLGNYAVAAIQNGKMLPFSLEDTYLLDNPYVIATNFQTRPPQTYDWWPFSKFALRDSNLSSDFPTSAQLALHQLQIEGGGTAKGVVAFTPVAIERTMQVIGNIPVPEYGEVVTPANLEDLIHKYQLTNQPETVRKHFTSLLAQHMLAKLHGLSTKQLFKIVQYAIESLHTKDIEIYFSDQRAEALLSGAGLDDTIAHGPGDAVTIVDSNVSGNKANEFVVVQYVDNVTLDAKGTATHNLTITYTMQSNNAPILFGRDYYITYLRMYTPANAKLLHMDGFNSPQLGPNAINQSDFPGRQMWGGFVGMQDETSYTLHFSWSVANAATVDSAGHWHYQLDYQRQAGSNQKLTLTVTAPGGKTPIISFKGALSQDMLYNVAY